MKLSYALLFVPLFMVNSLRAQTGTFTTVNINTPSPDPTFNLQTKGPTWLGGTLLVRPEVAANNPNNLIRIQPANPYTGTAGGVNSCVDMVDNSNIANASYLQFGIDNTGTWLGNFKSAFIASTANSGGTPKDLKLFAGANPFSGEIGIYLQANTQNVGIGTADTKGYKLAVAGSVVAESVKVKLKGNWPDYVFNEDYHLPSLQEVEKYVTEHQHLMDMPSAAEVQKEGQDLGDMNRRLLQKVEELTLYLIDLKKQQTALQESNTALQQRVTELEATKK